MATMRDDSELQAMRDYCREGESRARTLGNRGPVRFTEAGELHPEILEAYNRIGFYVFENVVSERELEELQQAYQQLVSRLPVAPESEVDQAGRPAIGAEHDAPSLIWVKPLSSDPFGATEALKGRHALKMYEPEPGPDLPEQIIGTLLAPLQYSDALLRLYAHPELLRVAAAVNGDDFVPFAEALIFKKAGEGASVSWHQDGMTHWDSPTWHQRAHGFNFMVQLYGSTAANGVWYIPGSHATGRADIKAMILEAGTDRLPGAVPLLCKAGDVTISNRQVLHSSFPNTSADTRITLNMGFLPRSSVLDVMGRSLVSDRSVRFDSAFIRERSKMIGYAIDARRRHFPEEQPYSYRLHEEAGERYHWNEASRRASLGYNAKDLII